MKIPSDFQNHLIHCIQEEHGIGLSEKAVKDIKKTIEGAYQVAAEGSLQKQRAFEVRYYEQKVMYEKLIKEIGGVLER
ncbi:hypothetical protein [Peribacillus simplex]|uniref:hypothetical protein n=1 Tax=Peribacillus simplex TaxID=1478 RepID=UPI0033354063